MSMTPNIMDENSSDSVIKAGLEMFVGINDYAGKEQADGAIVFTQDITLSIVREGQLIAHKEMANHDDANVEGQDKQFSTPLGQNQAVLVGKGVRLEKQDEMYLYYAIKDGIVSLNSNGLSVISFLYLANGIDDPTCDLDFPGDVFIRGSVPSGTVINAQGNVTITEAVQDDVKIIAGGNITVGKGILGSDIRISAQKTVRAKFVYKAKITAGENIILGNFSHDSNLIAKGEIIVRKGTGSKGGGLLGGKSIALNGIDIFVAGNDTSSTTRLHAGIDMDAQQRFAKVKDSISNCNKLISIIVDRINLASSIQGKNITKDVSQLSEATKSYKKLLEDRTILRTDAEQKNTYATIKVKEVAYPAVIICIGTEKLKLTQKTTAPCFKLLNDELVVR